MAFSVRFPALFANGLEQTWRFDEMLHDPGKDYFGIQYSIIDEHEPLKAVLARYLSPGDLVLEAGCGSGRWMNYLNRLGYRSVGVDISPEIIRVIRRLDSDLVAAAGNVVALPYRDSCFDAVLSSYVFEHFKAGPVAALREAYRVLKPGGVLFFIVPYNNLLRRVFFNRLFDLACQYYRPRRSRLAFVEYRFGRRECLRYLKHARFQVDHMYPDDFVGGWNKSITVDYRNLQFYWPALPSLPDNFRLPRPLQWLVSGLLKVWPWSCCGGIVCVAHKPAGDRV